MSNPTETLSDLRHIVLSCGTAFSCTGVRSGWFKATTCRVYPSPILDSLREAWVDCGGLAGARPFMVYITVPRYIEGERYASNRVEEEHRKLHQCVTEIQQSPEWSGLLRIAHLDHDCDETPWIINGCVWAESLPHKTVIHSVRGAAELACKLRAMFGDEAKLRDIEDVLLRP